MSHVGWAQGYPTRQVRVIVPSRRAAQQLRAEEEKWAKVIRAGNIKAPQ
jgi:hypothetical protein